MKIVELILDEDAFDNGVEAISIVENPAIRTDFVALSEQNKWKFANQDAERQILIGPALIPNQTIYRNQGGEEFYIFFSADTIRKVSERFFARGNQNNATLEHSVSIDGTTIVESWLVDDPDKDKSALYNFKVPKGTWMVAMKVWDRGIWDEYVKTGDVKGFSIEGYFADKVSMAEMELESYSDYPDGVKGNAKSALEWAEKNGWGSCGTDVGKQRANQLAKGEAISVETIMRMYSYLSRHEGDLDSSGGYSDGCGKLMYDAWGGKAGLRWAASKLKELGKIDAAQNLEEGVAHYKKDGTLYIGPTHKDANGRLMTGATHTEDSEYLYHKEEHLEQQNESEAKLALAILKTLVKINV